MNPYSISKTISIVLSCVIAVSMLVYLYWIDRINFIQLYIYGLVLATVIGGLHSLIPDKKK